MNKGIVSRIKMVIEHLELSVSAFADEIGVQRSSMSHLLNGRNKPSLDFVMKLVETYPEVSLDWLLKGNGNFPAKAEATEESIIYKTNTDVKGVEKNESKKADEVSLFQKSSEEPYKIIMFYTDGTFTAFNTKKD